MSIEFTIDILEQKKDRLFITGLALTDVAIEDTFSALYQYGSSKKSKQKISSIHLTLESIITDGNPAEQLTAQQPGMIVLAGDSTRVIEQAEALRWRKKGGRLIRTSNEALTLADA